VARPEPPVDTVRVAFDGFVYGHATTNVFWFKVATDGTRTSNDLVALLDALAATFHTNFDPLVGTNFTWGTLNAVWQTGVGTALAASKSYTHAGAVASPIDDAASCYVISWKIAARYRGGKPRTYLAGPTTAQVSNGSDLIAGQVTALAAAAEAVRNAMASFTAVHITSCVMGTVSFFTAGGSETHPPTYRTPPVFQPYISSSARQKLGTQRRRILS